MELSKDLYEAVYGKTLKELNLDLDDLKNVDINAFCFKCKVWAYNQGFILDSRSTNIGICFVQSCPRFFDEGEDVVDEVQKRFHANVEPEAVIKACIWLLSQIKNGNL